MKDRDKNGKREVGMFWPGLKRIKGHVNGKQLDHTTERKGKASLWGGGEETGISGFRGVFWETITRSEALDPDGCFLIVAGSYLQFARLIASAASSFDKRHIGERRVKKYATKYAATPPYEVITGQLQSGRHQGSLLGGVSPRKPSP